MRLRPNGPRTAVLLACLAGSASVAHRSAVAEPKSGMAAWQALVGNTISGSTPDGAYSDYFAPDGRVVHLDRDGPDTGRWTLRDPLVCLAFKTDNDEPECRRPEVDGTHGAFVDADGSRYPFDILPGNAKAL